MDNSFFTVRKEKGEKTHKKKKKRNRIKKGKERKKRKRKESDNAISDWFGLVWFGFMAYQPFVGYLTQNPFLCK